MIKLRTDTRTPTLTIEQYLSLLDQLYLCVGGDALDFMGRLPCQIIQQANNLVYAPLTHDHDELYALLTHDHDELYAPLSHTHDDDYAALSHTHDDDYAALSHEHAGVYVPIAQGLTICYASWVGDGSVTREITLSGTPRIHALRALDLFMSHTLYFWRQGYPAGYLMKTTSSGVSGTPDQFGFTADSTVFNITSSNINVIGSTYRMTLLGWRYQ